MYALALLNILPPTHCHQIIVDSGPKAVIDLNTPLTNSTFIVYSPF